MSQAAAAEAATPVEIERGFRVEGSMTLDTEGIGRERIGKSKAGRTDGVRRETRKAGIADSTIVGKRERKNTLGGFGDYLVRRRKSTSGRRFWRLPARFNRIYQIAKQSCREDAPP